MYRTIDLCAGIGGIRKGFEMTGRFENVLASEIDKNAIKTYMHLYGQDADHDLTDDSFKALVSETPYDVMLAGFPCQTFSSAGLKQGFKDESKGNIFFHLCEIIETTRPKAIFFENVSNLIRHNKGATFQTIIAWLEDYLNYKVVGVERSCDYINKPFDSKKFIRNTKNFGLPQNRSRTYIVAFDRTRYWDRLHLIDDELPKGNQLQIYENNDVRNLIELGADATYYLSEKYLSTLERHILAQHEKGNGFGYCILNDPENPHTISNTILATGGSGKERNLVIDPNDKYVGITIHGKRSPLNEKNIRVMTPREWGKLQGFINWAFIENGVDTFSFPTDVSKTEQYKQFGNAVSIPVIKTLAEFIAHNLDILDGNLNAE